MTSTPLSISHSVQQRRPHSGWSSAVALVGGEGVFTLLSGRTLLFAGVISAIQEYAIQNQLNLDRPTQSGRCRRDHAPT